MANFFRETKWTSNFSLWPTSNSSGNFKSDEAVPHVKHFLRGSMRWLMNSVSFCRFVDTEAMRSSLELAYENMMHTSYSLDTRAPKTWLKSWNTFFADSIEGAIMQSRAGHLLLFSMANLVLNLENWRLNSWTVGRNMAGHPPWPKNYLLPSFSRKLCGEAKPLRIAVSEPEWILKWLDLRLCNAFKLVQNHGNNLWLGNGQYQPAMPFSQGCHFGTESWSPFKNFELKGSIRTAEMERQSSMNITDFSQAILHLNLKLRSSRKHVHSPNANLQLSSA